MRNRGLIIGSLVVLLILVVGAAVITNNRSKNTNSPAMGNMQSGNGSASQSGQTSQASSAPVSATTVKISNFSFAPASITVKAGQTVTWTNEDNVAHTVTADTASADAPASQSLAQGASYSFTFKNAGTYAYHCQIHPSMKGTVTVTQ